MKIWTSCYLYSDCIMNTLRVQFSGRGCSAILLSRCQVGQDAFHLTIGVDFRVFVFIDSVRVPSNILSSAILLSGCHVGQNGFCVTILLDF